jgi:hypothetical protein
VRTYTGEGDGRAASNEDGNAANPRPDLLEAGVAVVEAAAADTNTAAPFFGDDGGGVSQGRAAGRRTGLEAGVDVVETAEDSNKVTPFLGEDGAGASEAAGSFAFRVETGEGVMALALDESTNKMEPSSGSYAVGDTSGSGGGSYAGRCDDHVCPLLDPELPNASLVSKS